MQLIALKSILLLGIVLVLNTHVFAQEGQERSGGQLITLSGIITCNDSGVGPLPDVHVYNKNKNLGSVSNNKGEFSIEMDVNDTIWFSTVQHIEQFYKFPRNEVYQDQEIEVFMQQDTVWLEAVTIYGFKTMEQFKREILQLDLPSEDISVAIPVLDKYAKQRATGDGEYNIKGPLTAVYYKLNRIARLRASQGKKIGKK